MFIILFFPSLSYSASCSLKGKQVFTYIHTWSRIMFVMQKSHDVIGVSRSSPDDLPYPAQRVLIPGWCSGKRCPNTFNCIHQEINANLCNRVLSSEGCVIEVYCRTPLDVTRKLILIEDLFAWVQEHLFCYVICKFWEP